jgi:hypothetical protein
MTGNVDKRLELGLKGGLLQVEDAKAQLTKFRMRPDNRVMIHCHEQAAGMLCIS